MIQSKKLLLNAKKKQYTLTVTTNPASATVTLTYDGTSYTSNTATVDEGTVISYSVYQSTYGTTTGTITMDSDKTLTCTGTYSTSTTDVAWSRPNLNSNGSVGGSSCACYADGEGSNNPAYKAFDGSNATADYWVSTTSAFPHYIVFYTPTAIKLSSLTIYNRAQGYYAPKDYTLYASNSNGSWTSIASGTNTVSGGGASWSIYPSTSSYYKYFKLNVTSHINGSSTYVAIGEIDFNAVYEQTSYTYYWNTTIT